MKGSGWNRDGKSVLAPEPVLISCFCSAVLGGILRLNVPRCERDGLVMSAVGGGWGAVVRALLFAMPFSLTACHPVTDSLFFPVEGWMTMFILDGLIDSQKQPHYLVRHMVRGTEGPRVAWQSHETCYCQDSEEGLGSP